MRFILEHSLSPKLADALAALDDENEIAHLRRWYPNDPGDLVWIPGLVAAGEGASIVVTGDDRIYRNPAEREAWLTSGLTFFFLRSFAGQAKWVQAAKMITWWPRIVTATRRASKGAGFLVTVRHGEITELK